MVELSEKGSVVEEQKPQETSSPKERAVAIVKKEVANRSDRTYAASDHFIVVYKNIPNIYRKFGSWLDTHPLSLAAFLEGELPKAVNHFQIDTANTVQVVDIRSGGFLDYMHGYHSGSRRHILSFEIDAEEEKKKTSGIGFSHVFPRGKDEFGKRPDIYETAIHEAIGHGIVTPALLGDEESKAREVRFLEEGLAEYTTDLLIGRDSHDVIARQMVDDALLVYYKVKIDGTDAYSREEIIKRLDEKGFLTNVSLANYFKLKFDDLDIAKSNDSLSARVPDYYRGASFVKYLIDTYGVEQFKSWAKNVTPESFYTTLETAFGKPRDVIESEWKKAVMKNDFKDNPLLKNQHLGFDTDQHKQEGLDWVNSIFQTYT